MLNKIKMTHDSYKNYNSEEYYSWINKNFNSGEYSFDPGYSSKTFDELCGNTEYSLKPQQKFASQVFNTTVNNNGILIYHGLGSGKTQTSIVIGEAFKYKNVKPVKIDSVITDIIPGRQKNRVLIVVPAALVKQYYSEIIGKLENGKIKSASGEVIINGQRQYYTDDKSQNAIQKKYDEIKKLKKDISEGNSDISKLEGFIKEHELQLLNLQKKEKSKVGNVYEILSHDTFLNKLSNGIGEYIDRLHNSPNGLLIIDEAHNLVSAIGSSYRKLLNALTLYAHPRFRTVLLSATPIYDKPFEIGLMLNLLRPRIPFPDGYDNFNEIFINKTVSNIGLINQEMVNKELFKKMCSGYISYFKGGNPEAYPYKKTIIMNHFMNTYQYSAYKDKLIKEVEKDKNSIPVQEEFIIAPNKAGGEALTSSVFNNSRLFCNIVFPEITLTEKQRKATSREKLSDLGLATFKEMLKNEANRDRSLSKEAITKNVLKIVSNYSSKFASVAEIIEKSEGPVFVYSNYVNYGVESMAAVMNSIGYEHYPTIGHRGSYFIWKGGVKPDLIESAKKAFDSIGNLDGSKVKIMFGTQSVMEGVDFKRVRQVHVLDPWWNDSRMQQIIARAIRWCSHTGLPDNSRITDVFIHLSALGAGETLYKITYSLPGGGLKSGYSLLKSINESDNVNELYFSEARIVLDKYTNEITDIINIPSITFKSSQLVSIEKLTNPALTKVIGKWKKLDSESVEQYMWGRALSKIAINRQFERCIKSVSIDCEVNKNGNIIRLDEMYLPSSRPGIYKLEYSNPSSGRKYTRLGIKSKFNKNLEDSYLTFDDILSNTAKNSGLYKFKDTVSDKIVNFPKSLIITEDIKCETGKYSFNNIPKSIVDLTFKKEFIPYLMKMDIANIQRYFLDVEKKNIVPTDPKLAAKIRTFNTRSDERQLIINKFVELGMGDESDFIGADIKDLKFEYNLISKNNNLTS